MNEVDPLGQARNEAVANPIVGADESGIGQEARDGEVRVGIELVPPEAGGTKRFVLEFKEFEALSMRCQSSSMPCQSSNPACLRLRRRLPVLNSPSC